MHPEVGTLTDVCRKGVGRWVAPAPVSLTGGTASGNTWSMTVVILDAAGNLWTANLSRPAPRRSAEVNPASAPFSSPLRGPVERAPVIREASVYWSATPLWQPTRSRIPRMAYSPMACSGRPRPGLATLCEDEEIGLVEMDTCVDPCDPCDSLCGIYGRGASDPVRPRI